MLCEARNATRPEISISTNVTAANVPAFAHSTGRRFGTAMNVERI